jgi:hypothetical protein
MVCLVSYFKSVYNEETLKRFSKHKRQLRDYII